MPKRSAGHNENALRRPVVHDRKWAQRARLVLLAHARTQEHAVRKAEEAKAAAEAKVGEAQAAFEAAREAKEQDRKRKEEEARAAKESKAAAGTQPGNDE